MATDFKIDFQRDSSSHYLNGEASVTHLMVNKTIHEYYIDSAFVLSVKKNKPEQNNNSNALAALHINGDIEPVGLQNAFFNQVNAYFNLTYVLASGYFPLIQTS